ncbi:MAG: tol-pal system-associated acyl-CoA thioesterase [Rhodobacteraceae bacterium]|nr:tol-pal system-associated acyl-CoA thioesterase [Paracoccaceae bacterium]
MPAHRFACRVYYEDTDLAGIVYYANYLRFIERARSEWVRGLGLDQVRLRQEAGIVLAVRRLEADYLRPARFDDLLVVETRLLALGPARLVLAQDIRRGEERLFASAVTVVALAASGAPARLPAVLRRVLAGVAGNPPAEATDPLAKGPESG